MNSLFPVGLEHYLALSVVLFAIGMYGFITRRNAVSVLMATELILNSVNINLIAFNRFLHSAAMDGQIFTLFTITIAAAEATIGLALVVAIFRQKRGVMIENVNLLKW